MSAHLRAVPATAEAACIYIRQSVERDESVSEELQELACRDYAERLGYEVVDVVVDIGRTGRTTNRRQINAVVDRVATGDYSVILVWKWSRISRSRTDWAILADRVEVAGGRIESATEPIDTGTASGRFARGVMTEYAAFQSEQIGEQWNEVHARRFRLGLPPTGKLPWGWTSKKDHFSITPESAEIIRTMYRLYFDGKGATYIAQWLNRRGVKASRGGAWRAISVKTCLDSPIHAGKVTYRGETRDGAHEGIIAPAEYARYVQMRSDRYMPRRPRTSPYLLSTLVVCHCGMKMAGWSTTDKRTAGTARTYRSYKCSAETAHVRRAVMGWKIEVPVVDWLRSLDARATTEESVSAQADVEVISREILALSTTLDQLTMQLAKGIIPEASYERTRDALLADIARAEAAKAETELHTMLPPSAYLHQYADDLDRWDELDIEDKQAVLRSAIRSVTIREDRKIEVLPRWRSEQVVLEEALVPNAS